MSHVAMDHNHMDIMDYIIDDLGENKNFDIVMTWVAMTKGAPGNTQEKMELIQSWIDSGRVEIGDKYKVRDKESTRGRIVVSKEEMIEKYGSLLNYARETYKEMYGDYPADSVEPKEKFYRSGSRVSKEEYDKAEADNKRRTEISRKEIEDRYNK